MSYWDFEQPTTVYDRLRRSALLVFLPDDSRVSNLDAGTGCVALDYGHEAKPRFVPLSRTTTFGHAQEILGTLHLDCRGPNIPPQQPGQQAADADVITDKLRRAGLALAM